MTLAVRTDGPPAAITEAIRRELQRLDAYVPLAKVQTVEHITGEATKSSRMLVLLVGLFAALALVLAAVGIYGVLSYSVAQRMHEFGQRIALGARSGDVLRLVLAEGARLSLVGVALGLGFALALGKLLSGLLYGVGARDPLTLAVAAGVAILVALAAGYIPAWRSTRVDPMSYLRAE